MKFIEVSASGEWDSEKENYDFEPVNNPTYFNASRIEWFDINYDDMSVCFGVIGYQTVFLATASSSVSWFISMKNGWDDTERSKNV